MDKSKYILKYIPTDIKLLFNTLSDNTWKSLNEISFINGQAITVQVHGRRFYLGDNGTTTDINTAYTVSKTDISRIFELITESSAYAYNRFINDGFLTLKGGHRVGIVGNCVCIDGKISNVNNINSFCFRIAHDICSNVDFVFDEIYKNGTINNTIIISPPGCGKTTLIRSIASSLGRIQSDKKIIKCTVIDERYEIAACYEGKAALDVGNVTNIVSGCKKSVAIPLVVRSMCPDVILMDELASQQDITAVKYALASGCSIIATTHGINEKINELSYFNISSIFNTKIILNSKNGPGTIGKIIGGDVHDN